ncbi:hypothetical protein J6590_017418 [Homalodisca vitripennis]|nr:hypothetical protein J6590_017418 [Homalodisca vitripennis]
MTVFYSNIQCLTNKVDELDTYLRGPTQPSIVCITEHWLNEGRNILVELVLWSNLKLNGDLFSMQTKRYGKKWPKKCNTGSWYSPELHELKNYVMTLHTIANCTKSPVDKQAYITARNQYKSAIRDAKKSTNEHFIDTSGNKTKAAWQVVKSLTGSSSSQSVISPSQGVHHFLRGHGGGAATEDSLCSYISGCALEENTQT